MQELPCPNCGALIDVNAVINVPLSLALFHIINQTITENESCEITQNECCEIHPGVELQGFCPYCNVLVCDICQLDFHGVNVCVAASESAKEELSKEDFLKTEVNNNLSLPIINDNEVESWDHLQRGVSKCYSEILNWNQ